MPPRISSSLFGARDPKTGNKTEPTNPETAANSLCFLLNKPWQERRNRLVWRRRSNTMNYESTSARTHTRMLRELWCSDGTRPSIQLQQLSPCWPPQQPSSWRRTGETHTRADARAHTCNANKEQPLTSTPWTVTAPGFRLSDI